MTNPTDIPALVERLRDLSPHSYAKDELAGCRILREAADALEQLLALRKAEAERDALVKQVEQLQIDNESKDERIETLLFDRDGWLAERDALAKQMEQLQAQIEIMTSGHLVYGRAMVLVESSVLMAERDALRAKCERYEKALQFYAETEQWKDRVEVWGYGQGQHRAIIAPAKIDAGALAREALAEDKDGTSLNSGGAT